MCLLFYGYSFAGPRTSWKVIVFAAIRKRPFFKTDRIFAPSFPSHSSKMDSKTCSRTLSKTPTRRPHSCNGVGWNVALFKVKKNKLWIWKAVCSHSGRLIDWEFGSRDREALMRLMKRLEPWNVLFYCADHYEAYKSLISPHRLFQGKARTHGIERNNGQQRHWFLRFKRKSLAPSRSLEMVDLTMALFAAYHVNKTLHLQCILN